MVEKSFFTLTILGALLAVAGMIGSQSEFMPSDEEWEEIYLGRESIKSDDFQLMYWMRHGFLYPSLTIMEDFIYGETHSPVSMNALFVLLCVVAVYLAIMAVTGKRWIALVRMFFLFLNPR